MIKVGNRIYVSCANKGYYCLGKNFNPLKCNLISYVISDELEKKEKNPSIIELQCIAFDINLGNLNLGNYIKVKYYGFDKLEKYVLQK